MRELASHLMEISMHGGADDKPEQPHYECRSRQFAFARLFVETASTFAAYWPRWPETQTAVCGIAYGPKNRMLGLSQPCS
jgi:hypothetical protein